MYYDFQWLMDANDVSIGGLTYLETIASLSIVLNNKKAHSKKSRLKI